MADTIRVERDGPVTVVTLCRPEVHNAFDSAMIAELNGLFDGIVADREVRLVAITGEGKSFCAGADLNWMREIVRYSFEQNLEESRNLARLMWTIASLPVPTIALVNGAALGGGCGLAAVCDVVIASTAAVFSLSEVKIGLVPACISPYVIRRMGDSRARQCFLTGERLTAERAVAFDLANEAVPPEELPAALGRWTRMLLTSGPEALATAKQLLMRVPGMTPEEFMPYTAEVIARMRVSSEGQEGMAAFLEKRKPSWVAGDPGGSKRS
ncbi:MAG: enoyl-CoA hydratase/isomerase family protein [Candidatus Riflebacteria bacterium]|nr:enoyl-CoA hydratase/isomerase family protein [Candidatus Riflebacteria bacterium]